MESVWVSDQLAVSVARIDFLDPAVADQPDARERGVRIEVRRATSRADGSIYVSPAVDLHPAICRIDLLESAPGAADRMHWHPDMHDGEPGDRTFDADLPADPVGWLTAYLHGLGDREIEAAASEIGAAVEAGLAWARSTPWPEVERDGRGMPA
ncbi:hypothetical protein [Nocardioides cynanchi]|uniref:hypothetical protein n=1 Tax=Nocardioides cynanchi TaxID=2558918 RepID=UPI001245DEB8|nr:hypothetical protein [Nocardioides cynanchi]